MTIDELLPQEAMALTIWGEARGEPIEGQVAVGWVMMNRYLFNPKKYKTIKEVCLEPLQFSCWNEDDPNREKMLKIADQFKRNIVETSLRQCNWVAEGIMHGNIKDNTKQSLNYMTTDLFMSESRPKWAFNPRTDPFQVGNHTFFTA